MGKGDIVLKYTKLRLVYQQWELLVSEYVLILDQKGQQNLFFCFFLLRCTSLRPRYFDVVSWQPDYN